MHVGGGSMFEPTASTCQTTTNIINVWLELGFSSTNIRRDCNRCYHIHERTKEVCPCSCHDGSNERIIYIPLEPFRPIYPYVGDPAYQPNYTAWR